MPNATLDTASCRTLSSQAITQGWNLGTLALVSEALQNLGGFTCPRVRGRVLKRRRRRRRFYNNDMKPLSIKEHFDEWAKRAREHDFKDHVATKIEAGPVVVIEWRKA